MDTIEPGGNGGAGEGGGGDANGDGVGETEGLDGDGGRRDGGGRGGRAAACGQKKLNAPDAAQAVALPAMQGPGLAVVRQSFGP
jgi:hypothetical protein